MASAAQLADSWMMRSFFLPDGDAGIVKTINRMEALVNGPQGIGSALVRQSALAAVRGSVRNVTEIQAVFDWVRRNIEFRGEAEETIQSPEATLNFGAGDCDDHAMLIAAMLKSLGYQAQFKTVATARDSPNEFSHVYAVVKDKITGKWLPLDSTQSCAFPGWEPDDITREQMYTIKGLGFYHAGNFNRRAMPRLSGWRGLGDGGYDAATIQDIYSPVPIPAAPTQDVSTSGLIYNLVEPFAQAGASVIAHGQTPAVAASPFGSLGGDGSLLLWLGLGLVLVFAFSSGR